MFEKPHQGREESGANGNTMEDNDEKSREQCRDGSGDE
jgi:hypothetical protein